MTYAEFDAIVTGDYITPFQNYLNNGGDATIVWWRLNRPDFGGVVTEENYIAFCDSMFTGWGLIDQAGYDDLISRWVA